MHEMPGAYQQDIGSLLFKYGIKYAYLSLCRFVRSVFVKDKAKAEFI